MLLGESHSASVSVTINSGRSMKMNLSFFAPVLKVIAVEVFPGEYMSGIWICRHFKWYEKLS